MRVGEDEIPYAVSLLNKDGQVAASCYSAVCDEYDECIGLYPNGIVFKEFDNEIKVLNASDPYLSKRLEHEAVAALFFVIKAINVMNCTNVKILDNYQGSRFVNQRRKQKGLLPLFTYKTLHIDTSEKEVNRFTGTGTHASPRLHLRRGHIRKLATGKSVWVQSCMVGDPSKGFAHKDYALNVA